MTDYVKSTNFASKDALATGNPLKIVKGTEIDTEFNNIATAVATKADLNSPTFIGTPTAPTPISGTNTTQLATTAFVSSHIVGTSQLANESVTTAKLASGAATGSALGADVVKTTSNQTIAGVKTFSSDPVMGVSGLTGNIAAARVTNALNASGSAPLYVCRAWVNFNGTSASSPFTIANGGIRASGNVTSVTDNGVGDYTVNFTNAMPDANYAVTGVGQSVDAATLQPRVLTISSTNPPTASACRIIVKAGSATSTSDIEFVNVAIFR